MTQPGFDDASAAALTADFSRASILSALADGRALPAGELARIAGISPQAAESHLDKLIQGNLVCVQPQGRHHYYHLRDARVAELLESLSIAVRQPHPLISPRWEKEPQMRFARTCYGHLAGQLGVAITQALCAGGYLQEEESSYQLPAAGIKWFREIGIDVDLITRRPLAKKCVDWSERRHHLAGALGVALASRTLELGLTVRVLGSRALRLTDHGYATLRSRLSINI